MLQAVRGSRHAGDNLEPPTRRRLAVQRAAVWSAVRHYLDDNDSNPQQGAAALAAAVAGLIPALAEPKPSLPLTGPGARRAR